MNSRKFHCLSLCVMLLLSGCGKSGDTVPASTAGTSSSSVAGGAGNKVLPGQLVVMTTNALESKVDFMGQFKPDEITPDILDKTFEISGELRSIEPTYDESLAKIGVRTDENAPLITLRLEKQPEGFVAKFATGQQVKVRGKFLKFKESEFSDPRTDLLWNIVEAGPNPASIMTTAELAKEFKADAVACSEKYWGSDVYVTGEIIRIDEIPEEFLEKLRTNHIAIDLKGDEDVIVIVQTDVAAVEKRGLKIGDKVTFQASFRELMDKDGTQIPVFFLGHPVTTPLPAPGVTYGKAASK